MIEYRTLYWVVSLIIFLWFNLQMNSFDDGFLKLSKFWKFTNRLVTNTKLEYSTFVSRFRLGILFYILSWLLWFIIF